MKVIHWTDQQDEKLTDKDPEVQKEIDEYVPEVVHLDEIDISKVHYQGMDEDTDVTHSQEIIR